MKQGGIYHHRENQGNQMGRAGLEAPVAVPKAEALSLSSALFDKLICNVVAGRWEEIYRNSVGLGLFI